MKNIPENNEQKINNIFNFASEELINIKYFNNPIEFSNQELFYYKLYILLIMEIAIKSKLKDDLKKLYILNKREMAKIIITKKVLYDDEIIKNEDKMNILIIIILYDVLDIKEKDSINLNRLLQTKPVEYYQLIQYLKEKTSFEITEIDHKNSILLKGDTLFDRIYVNEVCMHNLSKSDLKDIIDEYKYNTLTSLLKCNKIKNYEIKIRNFLKTIVESNVYTEAITELFPNYNKCLLDDNLLSIKNIIDNRLKFYPFNGVNNSDLTDKFSCCSYIPIFFYIVGNPQYFQCLNVGGIIENSLHELNHINQNILFFSENELKLFYSPKRDNLDNKDGGEHLEFLLFGRKIETLKILECLYLLNEKNYEKSLEQFRTDFLDLYKNNISYLEKKEHLIGGKIFEEFFSLIEKIKTKEEFQAIEFGAITFKTRFRSIEDATIFMPKRYCKMGIGNN